MEVEGPSWSGVQGPSWSGVVCHSIIGLSLFSLQTISTLCVTGNTSSSLMWYPSCRLILTWPSSMTMPPGHTARSVRDFLQDRNVSVLPWQVKSLYLNPIEHAWDLLDLRVRARTIPSRNVHELAGALVEDWSNISQQELANIVQSMRRRCTAVLNAAGGHTR